MKKLIVLIVCLALAIILFTPIPAHLKDGGSTEYNAILYQVQKVHSMKPDIESGIEYLEGTIVKIFGFEVYNDVK